MKSIQRVLLSGGLLAAVALFPQSGHCIDLWPFKKAPQQAPAADQLRQQEAEAVAMLNSAESSSKPLPIYRQIVEKLPFTQAAATAQYRLAAAYEAEGELLRAFDEYQNLIDKYKFSSQFTKALDSQFSIAQKARSTKLGSILGVMKKKTDPEKTVKLFTTVLNNAPQGRNAPAAAFEIGKIHEEAGDTRKAIDAYKDVAEQYPRNALAAEAQKRVAELGLGRIEAGDRDAGAIRESREAAAQLPMTDPRLKEDALLLGDQIDEAAAERAFKTAKFYDRQGKFKAAVIYYSDVLRLNGGPNFNEARNRVNELIAKDPTLAQPKSLKVPDKQLAVQANANTKARPDYMGPPRPADAVSRMRTGPAPTADAAGTLPLSPVEEANLPSGAAVAPDMSLLTPAAPVQDANPARPDKVKSTEITEPALPGVPPAQVPPMADPTTPAAPAPPATAEPAPAVPAAPTPPSLEPAPAPSPVPPTQP